MFPSECRFEVDVTEGDVQQFAELTGDRNPLHTDPAYAATTEFGRPVAHGALLLGYVSRVLGMNIPGRRSVILGMRARFPKPVLYPTRVRVEGKLRAFDGERATGIVDVTIADTRNEAIVTEAEVSFSLHAADADADRGEQAPPVIRAEPRAHRSTDGVKRRLLLTGATGGLGRVVLDELRPTYDVVALTRTPATDLRIDQIATDLESDDSLSGVLATLSPRDFYGIVHMSAPPVRRGLITKNLADAKRHWRHGVEVPLLLAQWASDADSAVKRLVLFGSTAATRQPDAQMGGYSLAKAATEHLARTLVWDLAGHGATVNAVVPGFTAYGLNRGVLERAQRAIAARTPTGRLVEPRDVASVVAFLLSDAAAQVNGATIVVDGGMLS